MASVKVTCVECGAETAVTMNRLDADEFEVNTHDPDLPYTDGEWAEITHYLEPHEVRVLREKVCHACQLKPDADETGWPDLPPGLKSWLGWRNSSLTEAKALTWYRAEEEDGKVWYLGYSPDGKAEYLANLDGE